MLGEVSGGGTLGRFPRNFGMLILFVPGCRRGGLGRVEGIRALVVTSSYGCGMSWGWSAETVLEGE